MNYAPISIFACRRPRHLQSLLESLKINQEAKYSDLFIFIGGPKKNSDWDQVKETLKIAEDASGFKSIEVFTNFDLTSGSALIHFGVERILQNSESIIVLEDDLIVREDFLRYMNSSLQKYNDNEKVCQISGWNYGDVTNSEVNSTFFFPAPTPWGWGTWKRAWINSLEIQEEFSWLTNKYSRIQSFNFQGNYDCLGMIESVIENNYDAWDAIWYLKCFRNGRLVLHPNSTLVINSGFDGSGLNFTERFSWLSEFKEIPHGEFLFPKKVEISEEYQVYLRNIYSWIKISERKNTWTLILEKFKRRAKQHIRYYKKGFYSFHK
jgi:hypothetical protein